MHESLYHDDNCFLTLTYRDEDLPLDGALSKRELQLFIKRLRKSLADRKIKYYACGEYGEENDRPHYHLIIFGWLPRDLYIASRKGGKNRFASRQIETLWPYGYNTVGLVTHDSCQYVVGYIRKAYFNSHSTSFKQRQSPFPLASKGLGLAFALEYEEKIKEELCVREKGKRIGLPRYYKRKLEVETTRLFLMREQKDEELRLNYAEIGNEEFWKMVKKSRCQREKNLMAEVKVKGKHV